MKRGNDQAVIYKPGGEQLPGENNQITPLMNSSLCLKFTFLDSQLNVEYQEIQKTTTGGEQSSSGSSSNKESVEA